MAKSGNKIGMDFGLISNLRKQALDKGDLSLVQVSELSDLERLYYAKVKLGREISPLEGEQIINAHIAEQEIEYARIKIKVEELTDFSPKEIRVLMENGITGEPGMKGPFTLDFVSKAKDDSVLFKEASVFVKPESKRIENMIEMLLKGGDPGIRGHPVIGASYILEARISEGLRVYYSKDTERNLLIVLGYSKKSNQVCVTNRLLKIYPTRESALKVDTRSVIHLIE